MTAPTYKVTLREVLTHFLNDRLLKMGVDQRAYKADGEMFVEVGEIHAAKLVRRGDAGLFRRRAERVLKRTLLRLRRNAPAEKFRVSMEGPVIEHPIDYRILCFAIVAYEVETPFLPSAMEVNL